MSTCVERFCTIGGLGTYVNSPEKPGLHLFKEEWIRHYADRIIRFWLRWQTPLGVAWNYVEQVKKDLAEFYDEPLKKKFIEATY